MNTLLLTSALVSWVLLLLNLLFTLALVKRINQLGGDGVSTKEMVLREIQERRGEKAPSFAVTGPDGDTITLDTFKGQTLTLIFMSATCKPCVKKIPALNAYYRNGLAPEHQFLVVDTSTSGGKNDLVDDHGLQLPLVHAPYFANSFATDYGADSTPYFVTITPQRTIYAAGVLHDNFLEEQLI